MDDSKFLIIGGTEKAGTTSLFQYLADSKYCRMSRRKETDYFRRTDGDCRLQEYLDEFDQSSGSSIFVEASPGYLADSNVSAPNIKKVLGPSALMVFILRSPLARLKSSFQFHQSRLFIPLDMTFDDYLTLCRRYEDGETAEQLGLGEWFLRVPDAGRYARHLSCYDNAGLDNLLIFSFDRFCHEPASVLEEICHAAGINFELYDDYAFDVSNQTMMYRNALIQKLALWVNNKLEGFFVRYPGLKRIGLNVYRHLNGAGKEGISVSSDNLDWLYTFYEEDIKCLAASGRISESIAQTWLSDMKVF
jgi:hypothetical protein